jgi:hypothetical protein
MARPITEKWIGPRSARDNPVLTPICNINGVIGPCYIIEQVSTSKYKVYNIADPTLEAVIKLTNGSTANHEDGYLAYVSQSFSGYVERLTDRTLRTFAGESYPWDIYDYTFDLIYLISTNSDYSPIPNNSLMFFDSPLNFNGSPLIFV